MHSPASRLGLEASADELLVDTPFDYTTQAMLYLARDLPDPRDARFATACSRRMAELLEITEGRAFVLFTSHRALSQAASLLAPPGGLIHCSFRARRREQHCSIDFETPKGAVLLATGTFWEGVDVPGEALSQVIIDKLPRSLPRAIRSSRHECAWPPDR